MFNFLVSGDEDAWEGNSTTFQISRCVREYTDDAITKQYGDLDAKSVEFLLKLPAIFAYEKSVCKAPKFGRLLGISRRTNRLEVRLDYELLTLPKFLTNDELWMMQSELDVTSWESSRTHWAVKDVDLTQELLRKGIVLPPQFAHRNRVPAAPVRIDITKHQFKVGFSFPGEYRGVVQAVAEDCAALLGPHACFYDYNYQAQLAQPSIDILLQHIYAKQCGLLVVLIGKDYQRKEWPGIEWKAIRSILASRENSRIMYVRVDDGEVDGVFSQDGFIDARRFSPAQIAGFIVERVELAKMREKPLF